MVRTHPLRKSKTLTWPFARRSAGTSHKRGGNMRHPRCYLLLLCSCLLLFSSYPDAWAQDGVAIVSHSIKPVSAGSSARFIKVAWKVKLRNEIRKPVTVAILFSFLDENEDQVAKAEKTVTLKAREMKTASDTVLIRSAEANKIATCDVSVTVQ